MNLSAITDSHHRIAGVDEAGRGPLAGPVVVAAVMLPAEYRLPGLDDSQRLQGLDRFSNRTAPHPQFLGQSPFRRQRITRA